MGAGTGFGVATGSVGGVVFDLAGAEVATVGSTATGFVGAGAGARVGGGVGVCVGTGVLGAGVVTLGTGPEALTVVEDPAGIERSTPSAVVSTVPEIVTMVVSPLGETETYESEPARITDAIPAL
jgi:hypothetical protein